MIAALTLVSIKVSSDNWKQKTQMLQILNPAILLIISVLKCVKSNNFLLAHLIFN